MYLLTTTGLYRIQGGVPVLYATLPETPVAGDPNQAMYLESYASGLIAASLASWDFYHIDTNGNVTLLYNQFFWQDFAVNRQGMMCTVTEDISPCRNLDGSIPAFIPTYNVMSFGPGVSLAFDTAGRIYESDVNNLYVWQGSTQTALITDTVAIGGTLTGTKRARLD